MLGWSIKAKRAAAFTAVSSQGLFPSHLGEETDQSRLRKSSGMEIWRKPCPDCLPVPLPYPVAAYPDDLRGKVDLLLNTKAVLDTVLFGHV